MNVNGRNRTKPGKKERRGKRAAAVANVDAYSRAGGSDGVLSTLPFTLGRSRRGGRRVAQVASGRAIGDANDAANDAADDGGEQRGRT